MDSSNLILIIAAEVVLVLLIACVFLTVRNRSLKKLIEQLKSKAKKLLDEVKKLKLEAKQQASAPPGPESETNSYLDFVEQNLSDTLSHHAELKSNQPIALDIEPGSPLPHRTASLRHAVMLAEKEAFGSGEAVNWKILRERYDQIFSFYEDFSESGSGTNQEYDELHNELQTAKKRISNLEKFKKLYFDLEEQWNNSKNDAAHALNNLSVIASEVDETGRLSQALNDYHSSYDGVSSIFETHALSEANSSGEGPGVSAEVKQLRSIAADQHRIIQGLQQQLANASSDSERETIVSGLQNELQKQARFIQESETCIQLLEDELSAATAEIEQLKNRTHQLPQLKTELVSLRKESDALELKYHNVISENRRLQKQLKEASSSSSSQADPEEAAKLKKQLAELADRYNDLEERFLDLKMQQ